MNQIILPSCWQVLLKQEFPPKKMSKQCLLHPPTWSTRDLGGGSKASEKQLGCKPELRTCEENAQPAGWVPWWALVACVFRGSGLRASIPWGNSAKSLVLAWPTRMHNQVLIGCVREWVGGIQAINLCKSNCSIIPVSSQLQGSEALLVSLVSCRNSWCICTSIGQR